MELNSDLIDALVEVALSEDLGQAGDVTTNAIVPADAAGSGRIIARQAGVVAGLPLAAAVFHKLDEDVVFEPKVEEGDAVAPGGVLAEIRGGARALLTGERSALNLLQRLSGIATLTRRCVEAAGRSGLKILDTRKTAPGLRFLEKYAVRVGGGVNHRMGLYDQVLIKDNHIQLAGSIAQAVALVRKAHGSDLPVEVEAETLDEVREALAAGVDIIMFDNMTDDMMRQGVALVRAHQPASQRPETEASGRISPDRLAAIAALGVDSISLGALTHSAPALDIGMDIEVG